MNDKLRSILHTAWNEPRHFFLWLAMLSICGFVAAVGAAALLGPKLLLSLAAAGCILCSLISIPAFILAWIPPIRRVLSRLLRWRFLALACLVTLVALFYAIEDWRGRRAWQSYKRAWEAKGERFEWAKLAPPPVPSDQNFFETPLWDDLHAKETNRSSLRVEFDADRPQRVIFSVYDPQIFAAPSTGNWTKAQRVDLAAWQAYYRGSSNYVSRAVDASMEAFRRRYLLGRAPTFSQSGPLTNYFPVAKEPQTPAADVLMALSKFNKNRQLLVAASARPQARFWINYDAGFAMSIPHLARLKSCFLYLCLHAEAALKAGEKETALEDIELLFRLVESIRGEPTAISQLVRIAVVTIALQPIWEGLADQQWTEAELSVIESKLGTMDFLADYEFAMRGERGCNLWWVDYIHKSGMSVLKEMSAPTEDSRPAELEQFLGMATFRLIPAGWFDQNKLSLCRMYEKYLLPLVEQQDRRVVSRAAIQEANSALRRRDARPYDGFSKMLPPALAGFADNCARAQTSVDLARVACALERYRLANGQFPDALDSLTPKFIAKLPHDVINGQPLIYRRADDGQFILYSVGWNETDDGGKVGLTKNGSLDWSKGDWVWHYPTR
jgi:hypothetical protein